MRSAKFLLLLAMTFCCFISSRADNFFMEGQNDGFILSGREVGTNNVLTISINFPGFAWKGYPLSIFFDSCVFQEWDGNNFYTIIKFGIKLPYEIEYHGYFKKENGEREYFSSKNPFSETRNKRDRVINNSDKSFIKIRGKIKDVFDWAPSFLNDGEDPYDNNNYEGAIVYGKRLSKPDDQEPVKDNSCLCIKDAFKIFQDSLLKGFVENVDDLTYFYSHNVDRQLYVFDKEGKEALFRNSKKRISNFYTDSIPESVKNCLLQKLTIRNEYNAEYFPNGTYIFPITKIAKIEPAFNAQRNPVLKIWVIFIKNGRPILRELETVRNNDAIQLSDKWHQYKNCISAFQQSLLGYNLGN